MTESEKWVRVMCDFSADGVWSLDGSSIGVDDLPISKEIKARLAAWQAWYEEDCEEYLPPEERDPERNFNRAAFSEEGRQIAEAIKAELSDWTVVYFDEEKAEADNRDDGDRSNFEYEVRS